MKYKYLGDKMTKLELRGMVCVAVKKDNKCIRGRNSNMLVQFESVKHIVLARRLRKILNK